MGLSPNTALSPSIPLVRRAINNIEEHQRTVLDNYAKGMDRGMNTSPVLSLEEQQVEIKTASTGQQPVVTHTESQDNTLQLESPETEDTGIEQADPINVQTQDVEENAESAEVDTSEQLAQVANTDSQVDEEQQKPDISDDQEHHKMIIIKLPLMMMSRMMQYSSAIQLHNHSCQEVSEYPL